MLVLGINDSHDSSACIVRNGELLIALSEERVQRIKGMGGFPHHAIEACLKATGIKKTDIDQVAIATDQIVPNNIHNTITTFSIADHRRLHEEYLYPRIYEGKKPKLADVFPKFKPQGDIAYPIDQVAFGTTAEVSKNEMKAIRQMRLKFACEYFGIDPAKVTFQKHHRCHALYAYYINPHKRDSMVIVTSDSGGDGSYTSITVAEKGVFSKLIETHNSLIGKIYTAVTLILGMKPNEHEYKVMGMAPYASEYHKKGPRDIFMEALKVEGLDFVRAPHLKDFFFYFEERLKTYRFDGIAGGVQDFVETKLAEWFENISKKTGIKDFIFSGGVANNVKANKRLSELECVNTLFVPLGPGDESLSIGAAYGVIHDIMGPKAALEIITPSENAFLGPEIDKDDYEIFKNHPFITANYDHFYDCDLSKVAEYIANGEIVALCNGKLEFGARALGNRSLVADPSKTESVRKLNDLIKKRDFWMPFTPSILDESYDDYVINPSKLDSSFMTLSFDTTEQGRQHLKGAVHPYDYTVRPQRVTMESCPVYFKLISEFKKLTGIGALLNTSLNIHGKPIVMNPSNLLSEILMDEDIPLKYLVINETFYARRK